MIQIGKIALILWALGMAYVGYLLIVGQTGVALTALEAGRYGEVATQFLFVTLVFIGTSIACGLFVMVGIFNE
ncbi:MAG TPA: hypothetical protein VNM48_23690 [Chloroflexota bacterium]|nr:hypothetical protein [Chloroflexota bacterium]